MNLLFLGGTGVISSACTRLAAERGMNGLPAERRVARPPTSRPGVEVIAADMHDEAAVAHALPVARSTPSPISSASRPTTSAAICG